MYCIDLKTLSIRLCSAADEAGPASSPKALLLHLQKVSRVPTMQDKLQVLSDSLPDAPPPLSASCIDESNWEGNVNSEAWQYDCQVHQNRTFLCLLRSWYISAQITKGMLKATVLALA